jgi:hypothetical protein
MAFAFTTAPVLAKEAVPVQSAKSVELQQALRGLWVDHIFWVRSVIMSSKDGDAEAAKVAESKAVENARAIADSIVPFYGKAAGDKLFDLLAGHYEAIKSYMTAAYSGDKAGMDSARNDLMANADKIAVFLSSANPNWPKETLDALLMSHGAHHISQINAVSSKDFASEAVTWGSMKKHMYTLADALAAGIVKQFPKKI